MRRRILSLFLSVSMVFGMLIPSTLAAGSRYSDTQGHWAEDAIERWSSYGVVQGEGGSFSPDGSLTRAQMATILSSLLGLTKTGANPFSDVPSDAWYTPFILRCHEAGLMAGSDGKANPDAAISREEVMTMLCRTLSIEPAKDADLSAYADAGSVSGWAVPYVAALTKAGIVKGIDKDHLAPRNDMTRGSVMAVLNVSITQYINTPGTYTLADKDGLVLVAAGGVTLTGKTAADILVTPAADGKEVTFDKADVTGTITVQADNAKMLNKNSSKLPNLVVTGVGSKVEESKPAAKPTGGGSGGGSSTPTYTNLTIAEPKTVTKAATYQDVTITDAVGNGTVTLANLTVRGNLYIRGGGSSTVNLQNCVILGKIIMAKAVAAGSETPRLCLTSTPVKTLEADQPAIIEAADNASAVTAIQAKAAVTVQGKDTKVASITVPAGIGSPVAVTVTAGTVTKVEANSATTVNATGRAVAAVTAKAAVTVASGTVPKVEVPAGVTAPVAVSVSIGAVVDKVEAKGETTVSATGTVSAVTAEAKVTVAAGTVDNVTVPAMADHVEVAVSSGATVTDVTVNAAGTTITNDGTVTGVSTALETPPTVTPAGSNAGNIPTHIHKWDESTVTTAATCTADGEKTYTCTAADCTATKTERIPAPGHTWGPWTMKDNQKHTRTCSVCSSTEDNDHSFGVWVSVDQTNHKRTCSACKAEVTAAHTWDSGVVTKEPTDTAEGVKTYTCSGCNGTRTEAIAALGLAFIKKAEAAGLLTYLGVTVAGLNTNITRLEAAKLLAAYKGLTVTPASAAFFADCGAPLTDQDRGVIKAVSDAKLMSGDGTGNFRPNSTVTRAEAATILYFALERPLTTREKTFTDVPVDSWYYIMATDLLNLGIFSGISETTLAPNNSATVRDVIQLLLNSKEWENSHTHSYGNTWTKRDEKSHYTGCSGCALIETEAHSWDAGVVTTPPTTTEAGVKTFTCGVCGATKTESLPAEPVPTQKITAAPTAKLSYNEYGLRLELSGITTEECGLIETINCAYDFGNGKTASRSLDAATKSTMAISDWTKLSAGANVITITFTATPTETAAADGYAAGTSTFTMNINYKQEACEFDTVAVTAVFEDAVDGNGAVISGTKKLTLTGLKTNQSYKVAVRVGANGTINYREVTADANGTAVDEWFTSLAFDQCTIQEWEVSNVTDTSAGITWRAYEGVVNFTNK